MINSINEVSQTHNMKKRLYGTFQLNGSLALHSWYKYLAGFSAQFVLDSLEKYKIKPNDMVLDFFGGVGTTSIVCKKNNIKSISIELNPFPCFVAEAKLNWSVDLDKLVLLLSKLEKIKEDYKTIKINKESLLNKFFSEKILKKLLLIKGYSLKIKDEGIRNLFLLSLTKTLKPVSNCINFSPYFQYRSKKLVDAEVFEIFSDNLMDMVSDLRKVGKNKTFSKVICGDSKEEMKKIKSQSIDLIITSPPYLNNWDYSWITKLESLFLDYELKEVRDKLVRSSTYLLDKDDNTEGCIIPNKKIKQEIEFLSKKLERKKDNKSSKKFDIMVVSYFNDMYLILKEMKRVMKKGSHSLVVLGDSGLYGIHVKTDEIIGRIGASLGLRLVNIEVLRKRSASRHKIPLRESVVIFKK